jgi:hypothetical protein
MGMRQIRMQRRDFDSQRNRRYGRIGQPCHLEERKPGKDLLPLRILKPEIVDLLHMND